MVSPLNWLNEQGWNIFLRSNMAILITINVLIMYGIFFLYKKKTDNTIQVLNYNIQTLEKKFSLNAVLISSLIQEHNKVVSHLNEEEHVNVNYNSNQTMH